MIIHQVDQGTPEWLALRLGIPTASEFDKIVTPKGEPSTSARGYMARLLAERLLKRPLGNDIDTLEWVANGKQFEDDAARAYSFENDCEVIKLGFCTTDDGRRGCSLDRAHPDMSRIVEIKCPSPQVHMLYFMDGFGPKYRAQVQGQLLICQDAADAIRYSYHPAMPSVTNRTARDAAFLAKLDSELSKFCDELDEWEAKARASGMFEEYNGIPDAFAEAYPNEFCGVEAA